MAQFTGKVVKILDVVSGENERGTWCRGGFVLESMDIPGSKAAFTVMGADRLEQFKDVRMHDVVVVTYRPSSREFNEKWFTDLNVINVLRAQNFE